MDKIIVGLKRVVDYNVRVQVKSDGSGVETEGVKMSINPFDEIALEEALRIRERGEAAEVVAVSLGPDDAQQQLRTALAMGADGVCIGRAYIWGLAAFGQPGVEKVLEMLKAELAMVMGQMGARSIADIGPQHIGMRG